MARKNGNGRNTTAVQKQQTTAVVLPLETMEEFKAVERRCAEVSGMEPGMEKLFGQNEVIRRLQDLFDQPGVIDMFLVLKNSPLGFKTDEDPRKDRFYSHEQVRDCIIQGFMMGVVPMQNQMNIISSSAYVTKEGFDHLLKRNPKIAEVGLESYSIEDREFLGTDDKPCVAHVRITIAWRVNGTSQKKTLQFSVPWHPVSGSVDQALGKGDRRAYAWLYNKLTGVLVPDGDAADVTEPSGEIKTTAADVTDQELSPASEDDLTYIDVLLQQPALSDEFRQQVTAKLESVDVVTRETSQKLIGRMIAILRKKHAEIPPRNGAAAQPVQKPKPKEKPAQTLKNVDPEADKRGRMLRKIDQLGRDRYGEDWSPKTQANDIDEMATSLEELSDEQLTGLIEQLEA